MPEVMSSVSVSSARILAEERKTLLPSGMQRTRTSSCIGSIVVANRKSHVHAAIIVEGTAGVKRTCKFSLAPGGRQL